jgi:hypothetical protein
MKAVVFGSGTLSSMQIAFGVLFKLLNLPGADELLMIGLTLLGLVFFPCLAFFLYKRTN